MPEGSVPPTNVMPKESAGDEMVVHVEAGDVSGDDPVSGFRFCDVGAFLCVVVVRRPKVAATWEDPCRGDLRICDVCASWVSAARGAETAIEAVTRA